MARTVQPFFLLSLDLNTRVADRAAIEPDRGVQIGSKKLEVGSGSWKSEVGNRNWEVRSGKWEVGGQKSNHAALSLNGQKSEIRSSNFSSLKSEV